MVENDFNCIFVVENINISKLYLLWTLAQNARMPELPAVESRHAMVDFEKPHMSMNLPVMLIFFEHCLQRLKIRPVEIS